MKTTIEDVARIAKVSTATVSRALRGLPNVVPSTREKIIKVADELHYTIDSQASRLASGRSMTVGLILPLAGQWFYEKVSTAAESVLMEKGYDVLRYSIESIDKEIDILKDLSRGSRMDGFIFITIGLNLESREHLKKLGRSVVTIETITDYFPSVCCNNYKAAQSATQHLINMGHRNIGVISGLADDPLHFTAPRERMKGYKDTLREHDIEFRSELIAPGNFSLEGGAEAVSRLLAIKKPPSAVFAFSDEMAVGAMKTIQDVGLRIPEDISVIGFDDHDFSEYLRLTTIRQPVDKYGEIAANNILQLLKGETEKVNFRTILDTQLIIRSTTGKASF